jgi:hypothetical protein
MPDPAPLDDVRQISKLAYGFMAAKALFVALDLDVFSRLADGPKDIDKLAAEVGITPPAAAHAIDRVHEPGTPRQAR